MALHLYFPLCLTWSLSCWQKRWSSFLYLDKASSPQLMEVGRHNSSEYLQILLAVQNHLCSQMAERDRRNGAIESCAALSVAQELFVFRPVVIIPLGLYTRWLYNPLPALDYMIAQPTEHIRMHVTEECHVYKRGGEGLRLESEELVVILFAGGKSVKQGTQFLGRHVVSIDEGWWCRHEGGDAGASSVDRHTASK